MGTSREQAGRGDPSPRRARAAVAAVFTVHGAVTGGFATRIPWLQEHLGIGSGTLGLALAFPAAGAALAMPLAGRVTRRLGSRAALRLLLVLWCASLALPPLAPGPGTLCVALAVYGATSGMADVAMNALGVRTEELLGRPVMSGLHGMWSVGALAGSAAGTVAAHAGTDARVHLGAAAGVLALLGAVACRYVWDAPAPEEAHRERPGRRGGWAVPRSALVIGAVGFCAVFAEGASLDWSAVYLRDVVGSAPGVAAGCTTAFACTMAVARLAGDAAVRRFGTVRTVRAGGVLATAGGALVVRAGSPVPVLVGFGLLGLGIAVVVPLAFAAAGRSGPDPSRSIAAVATITYTSGLVAPTVIGQVADATSLVVSFGLVTACAAGLVAGAGVLRAPERRAAGVPADPAVRR
ncbi:MFS transporter [Streptomyces mashuensis]|uniref:MFS transporter n=1 Tax=Streptomyces mashuensis TaxID=33904 RepID=A0A919EC60_9ACTN|nr:MFS transporter [Streptomyces mashuensis]GHF38406.1 MFS transporter [Streptomyces mashuensis]